MKQETTIMELRANGSPQIDEKTLRIINKILASQTMAVNKELKQAYDRIELLERRLDDLYPYRIEHHLRLLKLEKELA